MNNAKKSPRIANGLSRRTLLKAGTAAGGVLLTAPRRAFSQAKMESELVFACNGGSTQTLFEQKIFPEFTKKYGTKISYVPGQSADTLAKLRTQKAAPQVDVGWFSGGFTYSAIDEGLTAEIDLDRVPNSKSLNPAAGKEKTGLPVGITISGLLNNTDVFKKNNFPAPTSWWDFWDPKYKDHVGLYSINATLTPLMVVTLAKVLTGDYKNIDAAFAKLRDLRANNPTFFPSAGAWETGMQQGDLWLANNNSARAMQFYNAKAPVGYAVPKEGPAGYQTWLTLTKGAPHPNVAHAFIDYLLSPDVQDKLMLELGYGPTNRNTKVPDDLKLFFPNIETVFMPDWRFISQQLPTMVDRWNKEIER